MSETEIELLITSLEAHCLILIRIGFQLELLYHLLLMCMLGARLALVGNDWLFLLSLD